ncbi:hypothetical protein C5C18_07865 [Rathayibacter tritici]|nr:hypothetical protein C5C21_04920 [Rathayibacter tritici]PPG07169.1 hypothetical protein C5C18_07865 [Rathayibacter tritici]PPI42903.1 hypothetical protein C5D18_10600 [Rathayibacter tritici]
MPLPIFGEGISDVASRAVLLVMNSRSKEPTLRTVRIVSEGQYRGTVQCDYSLAMTRTIDVLGHATFDTKEDDNFYATVEQEENGNVREAALASPAHANRDKPLSPPAVGLTGLLLARYGEPGGEQPTTDEGAYDALLTHGASLFGGP